MKSQLTRYLFNTYLRPIMGDYKIKGNLIYNIELQYFLRSIYFESSSYSTYLFTISVFVQPLFVPIDHLVLSIGNRLGYLYNKRDTWWEYSVKDEERIMRDIYKRVERDALPFLNFFITPKDYILFYGNNYQRGQEFFQREALVYSLLMKEDYSKGLQILVLLQEDIDKDKDNFPYLIPVFHRLSKIKGQLINREFEEIEISLKAFRKYTLASLHLAKEA